MSDEFFPPLDEAANWALVIIGKKLKEDPDYLKNDDCPYSDEVKALFEGVREVVVPGGLVTPLAVKTTWDKLQEEMASIFDELNEIGEELENNESVEPKDKINYVKAKAGLMQKLVEMQERVHGIQQISAFYRVVMDIMENVLTIDQRTKVMERLETARGE